MHQNTIEALIARISLSGTPLSIEELERRFPPRSLPPGAMVTRFAPSPTGYMHIGGIYASLICRMLTAQSGGVFYLRIEDTDTARSLVGAVDTILTALDEYGLTPDEGPLLGGAERGAYGPYTQTQRTEIYAAVAAEFVRRHLAYPCFCSAEQLEKDREAQMRAQATPGYYGEWARCRNLSDEEILARLQRGERFVLRLRSTGSPERRVTWNDAVRGESSLPENCLDAVLLKSDGVPLYHFAHLVDDHFMRSTHIVRADEWLPSTALHLQLFEAIGWPAPIYTHLAPIMKTESVEAVDPESGATRIKESRRKLAKRKDPEANYKFYNEQGIPPTAVVEYLLNIANSDFEEWREKNPGVDYRQFRLRIDGLSAAGALSDIVKLQSVSRRVIAALPPAELYAQAQRWAARYDAPLAELMAADPAYATRALDVVQNDGPKSGKRIHTWKDLRFQLSPFYEPLFSRDEAAFPANVSAEQRRAILQQAAETLGRYADSKSWFEAVRAIAVQLGFADKMGDYKRDPSRYAGTVADVAMVLRVAVVGRKESPDLFQVLNALGSERARARLGGA